MMSRNVRGFMSLFHSDKPVVCKVHGFCVAGGTDLALCSDLLVIEDNAKIGYPPARVWGSPTTAMWAHPDRHREGQAPAVHRRLPVRRRGGAVGARDRMRAGRRARRAVRGAARADRADAGQPADHDEAAGQPDRRWPRACAPRRCSAPLFDGITRHTAEGYAFQQRAERGRLQAGGQASATSRSATSAARRSRGSAGQRSGNPPTSSCAASSRHSMLSGTRSR